MKQTSKQKRPRKQKSKNTATLLITQQRVQTVSKHWLIYFYGPNNTPVCGITREGDVEWHENKIRVNYLKRAFNDGLTMALEAKAGIKPGMRRRMVLKTFKHIKNKAKKSTKQELVKYMNTTIQKLEKKETLRILQGKD